MITCHIDGLPNRRSITQRDIQISLISTKPGGWAWPWDTEHSASDAARRTTRRQTQHCSPTLADALHNEQRRFRRTEHCEQGKIKLSGLTEAVSHTASADKTVSLSLVLKIIDDNFPMASPINDPLDRDLRSFKKKT